MRRQHLESLSAIMLEEAAEADDRDALRDSLPSGGDRPHYTSRTPTKVAPENPGTPLRFVFNRADKDHSGDVAGDEMDVMREMLCARFKMLSQAYDRLFEQTGRTTDGKLDFPCVKKFAGILHIFSSADKDKDGVLSGNELDAFALAHELAWLHLPNGVYEKLLGDADVDNDNNLNAVELKSLLAQAEDFFLPPLLAHIFSKLDTDGDNILEGGELQALRMVLASQFSLSEPYLRVIFPRSPTGLPAKLDRRDFKHVLFTAWGGPPLALAGPWVIPLFKHSDTDHSSYIDGKEVDAVIAVLEKRFSVPAAKISKTMQEVDKKEDDDMALNPREFAELVHTTMKLSPLQGLPPKMVRLFSSLDKNGDHMLSDAEVDIVAERFLQKFHVKEDTYNKALKAADHNADGALGPAEFGEFVSTLTGLHPPGPAQPGQDEGRLAY